MRVRFLTPVHLSLRVNGISHCNFTLRLRAHLPKGAVDAQTSVRNEKTVNKCICAWAYALAGEAFKTGENIHQ